MQLVYFKCMSNLLVGGLCRKVRELRLKQFRVFARLEMLIFGKHSGIAPFTQTFLDTCIRNITVLQVTER